jgi:glycosyltransferase involved in cell wall biosynthesis
MGFASAYLEQRALFPEQIGEAVDSKTGIIIVVPAYNEPGINILLESLAHCEVPECKTEVIVVINAPDNATRESLENNRITLNNIESWKRQNNHCFFRLFAFIIEHPFVSGWGVGLARKTGMDEAVRRFNSINRPDGVILNLDADCTVERNYLVAVYNELLIKCEKSACSIYFEHPLTGTNYSESIFRYIALYELHLRYYFQGLAYSGFPYVFHTVGSAIAVKALPYIKAGGMNRRQAGEDFYFIQKLVPAGGFFTLNTTTVYPSPRASGRVPFGTGASIGKLSKDDCQTLFTYNFRAFRELRTFFEQTDIFFKSGLPELQENFKMIPQGLQLFLDEMEWIDKMMEVKTNTAGLQSFRKRFFGWFNMFRIVKYLNYVHKDFFEKQPVETAAAELLETTRRKVPETNEPFDLLKYYRSLEKETSI